MKKIQLAYLVSQYPAISHTFILREIRTLRSFGLDISVASINAPDRCHDKLTTDEIEEVEKTYYVKPDGITGAIKAHIYTQLTQPVSYIRGLFFALRLGKWDIKKILYGFFYFVEAVMVGQWMRRQQCSHLHIHFGTAATTVGLIINHTFPVTFSFTMHGPQDFYDSPGYYLNQKVRDAAFVCCISYFAQSQLMMLAPPSNWDKLEVSHLGVDPTTFTPRLFRSHTPFEILCVGRLVPEKGQLILVKAVARIIKEGHQLLLRLVGDGPDRQSLENYVAQQRLTEHIRFEGAVNQDRILDFYNSADVFVLASFAEGIPVVLMEAMIMEIPCITTNITGIPELIGAGSGILVAPSNIDALADAITLLIDKPELCRKLGQAGRQKVLQDFELQRNTGKLAEIFHRHLTMNVIN